MPQNLRRTNVSAVSHLEVAWERKSFCNTLPHRQTNSQNSEERQMTTDPVCGIKVDDKHPEFQTQFAGRKYFFCSDECRKEFEERPEEYVETAA